MSFHLVHCTTCHAAVTPNLLVGCVRCRQEICTTCTPSPMEMRRVALAHGIEGLWDLCLEAEDPLGDDGGGLAGFLCLSCYREAAGEDARPVDRARLRRIEEAALLAVYGRKFAPYLTGRPGRAGREDEARALASP